MEYNWGIIGAGRFADNVFAPAIKLSGGSRLLAVMARDKTKAEAFARKHEVPKFYDSAEALCNDPEVDVVYVASPTFLHCQHAVLAAQCGKQILCEKPMAPTLEECDQMIVAAEKNNITLMIGHNMRFHRIHQEIKEMIASGLIGTVGIARAEIITSFKKNQGDKFTTDQFRLNREIGGGGVLFDMGIHAIDVLRFILDDDIEEVSAFSQNLFIDCNGEDTIAAVLKFRKGAYGSIATSGALPYARNGIELYGENGALITDGSVWISVRSGEIKILADDKWKTHAVEINNCYLSEIEHFLECLAKRKAPAVTGREARQNIRVVLAAYRAMDEGRAIQIDA
ncbi:MAG: Gfo/Idh/MocA family oxidoreductase [Desulfobacterales bacterium]|jgi:predicted dehydrogenase